MPSARLLATAHPAPPTGAHWEGHRWSGAGSEVTMARTTAPRGPVTHGTLDTASLHRRSVEGWMATLDTVPDGAWDDPTPCRGWSVRDLVNHVVGEDLWTAPLLSGATIEQVGDRFEGDVLGADPRAAARAAGREALDATGALEPASTVHLSYGEDS